MFYDRYTAKDKFNQNKSNINKEWIIISGNKGIGKTAFMKEVTKDNNAIYCEPKFELVYWKQFYSNIQAYSEKIIVEYFNVVENKQSILYSYVEYTDELTKQQYDELLEKIMCNEIKEQETTLSKVIGRLLKENIDYIILDNLFLCDTLSYEWLLSMSEQFISSNNYVVAICDINVFWKSKDVKNIFYNTLCNIDISCFDNEEAYYNLLSDNIYFNNSFKLKELAFDLYNDFNGYAESIIKLINIVVPKLKSIDNDNAKEDLIYKTASNLFVTNLNNLTSLEKNILVVLSLSSIPLDLKTLEDILEHDSKIIKKSLFNLLDKDLVVLDINLDTYEEMYKCSTTFSQKTYINLVNDQIKFYLQSKLYVLYKKGKLKLPYYKLIEIILEIKPNNMVDLINMQINKNNDKFDEETKAKVINMLIENSDFVSNEYLNIETINLLYMFGYYSSAKMILESINDLEKDYSLLMKYGDVLHLTLDVNTAAIFEKASQIKGITISEKLSAINRQIMAMTQQDKKKLEDARYLYDITIKKYASYHCNGLVELYRNANNIYEYSKAIEYTIRGYKLACSLNNELEKIKCLHNICMLELHNETYDSIDIPAGLGFKPSFNCVYNMLSEYPHFSHETAYPLLDIANNEMFHFAESNDINYIKTAKSYYSEAQLYAKSFYAKNISEMGLLVVNSYLYSDSQAVKKIRNNLYESYLKREKNIYDFRVHRKILFSLATSAIITKDFDESKKYLKLSKVYVFEGEILRYNNLCEALDMVNEKLEVSDIKNKNISTYHKTIKFVPWLISFGH